MYGEQISGTEEGKESHMNWHQVGLNYDLPNCTKLHVTVVYQGNLKGDMVTPDVQPLHSVF